MAHCASFHHSKHSLRRAASVLAVSVLAYRSLMPQGIVFPLPRAPAPQRRPRISAHLNLHSPSPATSPPAIMRHAAPGPLREGGAASLGCLAALLLAFQPLPSSAASDVFMGVPRVVDGDTMVVAQQRVRMFGIDAPESKQPCLGPTGEEYACGGWRAASCSVWPTA